MLTRISTVAFVILAIFATTALASALVEPALVTILGGSHPTISPDGQWLAFRNGNQIFRMTLPGGSPELLVTCGFEPDWSAEIAAPVAPSSLPKPGRRGAS